jgi:hypothetical protein
MSSVTEYRQYADECLGWAKQAATDSERDLFLKMAEDWLRAATLLGASAAPFAPLESDATPPQCPKCNQDTRSAAYIDGHEKAHASIIGRTR